MLKLSAAICNEPLQTSVEKVAAYNGYIDLLKVPEIELPTETLAAPSSGEIAVMVGAEESLPSFSVDSSTSALLEQDK